MDKLEHEKRIAWFKRAILPHEAALRSYLSRKLQNPADIDDVVSEALIRAYATERFERFDQGRGYLFTIARNYIYDTLRRSRIIAFDAIAQLQIDPVDDAPSAERAVSGRDEVQHVFRLIEKLPVQARRVLLLRRIDGYSTTQIAEQLGLSVSTVEKHLTRALVLLTSMLDESAISSSEALDDGWPDAKTL